MLHEIEHSKDDGSTLVRFLFPTPAERSVGGIIRWWEARRPAYNAVVGSAGLVSIGLTWLLHLLPPGSEVLPLSPDIFGAILVVGVLANVFYCLGPTVETIVHKLWGREVLPVGPVLFRMGLTFSVGLVFLPTLMSIVYWVARVIGLAP